MTKEELRTDYVNKGWEVQPVADWVLVSQLEGKTKYDVNVVSPDNRFGTAQVVEDSTGAYALGMLDESTNFGQDLRAFLLTKEDEVAAIYAITINEIKDGEEAAEVNVYSTSGSDVAKDIYVVKRRNDTWDFKKLV